MKATTPYRRLQERVKELEEISKVHQKQNGKLQVRIKELEQLIEDKEDTNEVWSIDKGKWINLD